MWSVEGTLAHHNASVQVHPEGRRSRVVWIADFLPDEARPRIAQAMGAGMAAMQRALDALDRGH